MKKPRNYWTKEKVFDEAKKYKTKSEFKKGNPTAYQVARKNGWLKEMNWFKEIFKPSNYWTKERVFEEARKYQTKSEFKKGCGSAYQVALENGWLKEMTWFIEGRLKAFTIKKNDSVYKYYWEETNSIYIGRTLISQQKVRDSRHSTSEEDTVFRYAKENGLAVPPMEIIEENITVKEGLEREDYWVNYYKERGYNVLNIAKTGIGSGSIGAIGFGKWTKEAVFEEAKKYQTRNEFLKGCSSAYDVARKNKWLKEMTWFVNGYVKWTKEKAFEESKKYQTRTQFCKHNKGAYNAALENGWLDEFFPNKYIMTEEHKKHLGESKKGKLKGIYNTKKSKPVLQIDPKTNETIGEWPSIAEVRRKKGFDTKSIIKTCKGELHMYKGYFWRYKESVA